MLCSLVIVLEALRDCRYDHFTGRGTHGFWLNSWRTINPQIGDWLHGQPGETEPNGLPGEPAGEARPYTVSPLMGLPPTRGGQREIAAGAPAWLRITSLHPRLTAAMVAGEGKYPAWRENLPPSLSVDGAEWRIVRTALTPEQHPWANACSYEDLRHAALDAATPPQQWTLQFASPTCTRGAKLNGADVPLLFPIPDRVLDSWRKGWNKFAPFEIPEELAAGAAQSLRVTNYQLRTQTEKNRYNGKTEVPLTGYTGESRYNAYGPPAERAYFDLLFRFAFYRGTGFHTTQGFGQTQLVESR